MEFYKVWKYLYIYLYLYFYKSLFIADQSIHELRSRQAELSNGLQDIQLEISQADSGQNEINSQLKRMKNQKETNLEELVIKQNQAKELQKVDH